jgi:hypothetical protein
MWVTKTIYRWSVAIVLSSPAVFVSSPALRSEETLAKFSTVAASYTLPDLPLAAFQNGALPGTISNDRKILLGSIGSDLWRGPDDPEGVFWMITDRGPNGQIKVNGENRRTFPVPEFNPAILRVKVSGNAIEVLETFRSSLSRASQLRDSLTLMDTMKRPMTIRAKRNYLSILMVSTLKD